MNEGDVRPCGLSVIKVNQEYGRSFMSVIPKNPFEKGSDEHAAPRDSQSRSVEISRIPGCSSALMPCPRTTAKASRYVGADAE